MNTTLHWVNHSTIAPLYEIIIRYMKSFWDFAFNTYLRIELVKLVIISKVGWTQSRLGMEFWVPSSSNIQGKLSEWLNIFKWCDILGWQLPLRVVKLLIELSQDSIFTRKYFVVPSSCPWVSENGVLLEYWLM